MEWARHTRCAGRRARAVPRIARPLSRWRHDPLLFVSPSVPTSHPALEIRGSRPAPGIVESIRAGLVVAQGSGRRRRYDAGETSFARRPRWAPGARIPAVDILRQPGVGQAAMVNAGLRVHTDGRLLHSHFVASLLNDLFGIRVKWLSLRRAFTSTASTRWTRDGRPGWSSSPRPATRRQALLVATLASTISPARKSSSTSSKLSASSRTRDGGSCSRSLSLSSRELWSGRDGDVSSPRGCLLRFGRLDVPTHSPIVDPGTFSGSPRARRLVATVEASPPVMPLRRSANEGVRA